MAATQVVAISVKVAAATAAAMAATQVVVPAHHVEATAKYLKTICLSNQKA
jgi:hypothetical protein